MSETLREAGPDELAGWDARTVDVSGGDVQQSRGWAVHRARSGARPRHLVFADGFAVLGLERRRPLVGGGRLYLPRGPVAAGEPAARTAERLAAVAAWARSAGLDAVLSDAEIPAATGYPALLAERGFRPVEEVGPSRHRVAVPIPAGADDIALLEPIAKTTRQRFGSAERRGARVIRYDDLAGPGPLPGFEAPPAGAPGTAARAAFVRFHGLLVATGERRGFAIGPVEAAVAWWTAALEAGHLVLLEVRSGEDDLLAAAILYRHGRRLSYAHSGDRVELRHAHPGATHLLLWRALQLTAREGRAELDLGGVDVAGARHEPRPGEPMWGLYEFKRSFGGRWVEMAGAHEAILRPVRRLLGGALAAAARTAGRGRVRSGDPAVAERDVALGAGEGEVALRAALAAAEPDGARPLDGLIARLAAAGRLRAVLAGPGAGPERSADAREVAQVDVAGIAYDSRRVVPGACFVAVPGVHADGHAFAGAAVAAGAVALVVERPLPGLCAVQLVVDRSQLALAVVAGWWYGDPSDRLGVVGVTGTDGKTTTAAMAVAALEAAGVRAGLVSTAEMKVGPARAETPAHVTTPEAPDLQRALRAMDRAADAAAVVETTSHGLALERVGGIAYDVAIFTNLTHEHLELHGTFEAYRAAKRSLFERLAADPTRPAKPPTLPGGRRWPKGGIVNADDPSAGELAAATRSAGAALLTYGSDPSADVRALRVDEGPCGLRARVAAPSGMTDLVLPLLGRFNVHNALAVVALGDLLGLDPAAVRAGLEGFRGVRGRMERVDAGQPFVVVVDYAHTPASLATVLDVLSPLATAGGGGCIAVFGSAGERDIEKRALQGHVAGERCRLVVATDEDPRGEDRMAILEAIAAGAEAAGRRRGDDLLLVPDRRAAIAEAFARARPGDVVLLAGKGHERSIIYAAGDLPWDERAVALDALAALGWRARA